MPRSRFSICGTVSSDGRFCSHGQGFDRAALARFDAEMIKRDLSPGGCADLLALSDLLHALETKEE